MHLFHQNLFDWRSPASVCAGCWISVLLVGCQKSSPDAKFVDVSQDRSPVSFLVACDTNGWIVPCGCSTKQSGGLLRRGTLVEQWNLKDPVVVLDVGGAAAGDSEYHRTKFEAILKGEIAMGLRAHNLGAAEVKFGADGLRKIGKELKVPFVSANVFDASGQAVAERYRIVEKGGQRFAVIGVLGSEFASSNVEVRDPAQSVLDVLAQLNEKVDGIIVLAYVDRDELFELAKSMPEIDVLMGGPTGQTVAPTRIGATLVMSVTNKGKFVGQLRFDDVDAAKWSGTIVEVDDTLADHPDQVANLDAFHHALAARDFAATETGLSGSTLVRFDAQHRFAGTQACVKCHQADCTHYATTKHAVAWHTLQVKGSHVDPYCQQCHTTGYGAPGGFVSAKQSDARFDVGCESCHGPSESHVADPKIRTLFAAKDQCLRCHDQENSPAFEYDEYWKKIVHGAKVAMEGDAQ